MGGHPRILPANPSVWSAAVQLPRLGSHSQSRRLVFWGKGRGPHPCLIQQDESPEKEDVFPSKKLVYELIIQSHFLLFLEYDMRPCQQ